MIQRLNLAAVTLAMCPGLIFGAAPVATVSSSSPIELRGTTVNPAGVPSWPVMEGDSVSTSSAAATIQFRDGSRVTLSEKTRAKIEKTESGLVLRLLAGALEFKLASESALRVYNNQSLVKAAPGVTTLASTLPDSGRPVGKVTPSFRTPPPVLSSK